MKWTDFVSSQNKITSNAPLNYFIHWIQYYSRDKRQNLKCGLQLLNYHHIIVFHDQYGQYISEVQLL